MFSTFKQKLFLGIYIFLLLTIPVGSYLVSQYQTIQSSAKEQKSTKSIARVTPKPTTSPSKELLSASQTSISQGDSASPAPSPAADPTIATSYGPTLSFKATLEGSPKDNQTTRMFVGIAEGTLSSNPKFLLSFNVNLPASGEYGNISLAGLNSGIQYTALLKGASQIAASSVFTMSPSVSTLNNNEPLNLISGDLNDDNVINSADYSIAQKALGATARSSNWNENADFNKDGVINTFDLAIIVKNMGQTGASGAWTSPLPQGATPSANLTSPSIGGPESNGGYWIWVPK
ncbi:MAG: dockerin type I repeat-containing protein [Candidatus Daviesbacteria bacterium]|nr:dockerin type I repeat-containing protein [Candidatus Daviesbacteria bacterium]